MKNISLDITKAACFLEAGAVEAFEPKVKAAQQALEDGTCPGNDFLGWLHLPSSITPAFLDELQACADVLRSNCEAIVVAGIGGSYLGARAVIEALSNSFSWLVADKKNPTILFAGNNIGEDYLFELTEYLKDQVPPPRPPSPSVCSRSSVRPSAARPRPRRSSSPSPTPSAVPPAPVPTRRATPHSSSQTTSVAASPCSLP